MAKKVNKLSIKEFGYKKLRKSIGKIEIYNPTNGQIEEIKKMINETAKLINKKDNIELQTNFNNMEMVRYLIDNLTNLEEVDTLTDEELEEIISSPSQDLFKVIIEFRKIIQQVMEVIRLDVENMIKTLDNMVDGVLDMTKLDMIAKKMGIPLDTLIKISKEQKEEK